MTEKFDMLTRSCKKNERPELCKCGELFISRRKGNVGTWPIRCNVCNGKLVLVQDRNRKASRDYYKKMSPEARAEQVKKNNEKQKKLRKLRGNDRRCDYGDALQEGK
jgi:hypothetical protein